MDEINVIVVDRGRKYWYLRYTDPVTGQNIEKSARTTKKREAVKRAGEWQAEVNATGLVHKRVVRWSTFREDFFENYFDEESESYCTNVAATFNIIESIMNPDKLTRITTTWIGRFRKTLVRDGKPSATVHKYMQHLKTALKWAVDQKYLKAMPAFPARKRNAAKRKKHMKGRPVTGEEFDRMVEACIIESQEYLLNGLWLSGLRLGEALVLTWDQWADGIRIEVDDDGDVFLLIDSEDQKNRETVLYPVVDEFAEFLLRTPPEDRTGHVFNVCGPKGVISRRVDTVSDWLVAIGERAGVKVDQKTDKDEDGKPIMKPVFASAHDLRRAFGQRWSQIVPPMILRDLMRHASVDTTEKFYVGINAKKTVENLRRYKSASLLTLQLTPEEPDAPEGQLDQ